MSNISTIYSGTSGTLTTLATNSNLSTIQRNPVPLKVNKSFTSIVIIEDGNQKIVLPSVSSVEELRDLLNATRQELLVVRRDHKKLINEHNKVVKELHTIRAELKKKVSLRHGI